MWRALRDRFYTKWIAHSEREALNRRPARAVPATTLLEDIESERLFLTWSADPSVRACLVTPRRQDCSVSRRGTYYGISRVPEFWTWLEHQAALGTSKC